MSAWVGKYVIGLTGNIATGKSVVRKMLEHLGANGIDADALAHRAIAQGAPGYQPVVDLYGRWILGPDGQIDRSRLGKIVFSDPEALARLEAIVHPLVVQAVDILIRRSPHKVIVIEAIKIIESGLQEKCDSLWVSYAPFDIQLARLMKKRGMSEGLARQRIGSQPSQEAKIERANVVIQNTGSFEETWRQVSQAWVKLFPSIEPDTTPRMAVGRGELVVQRARPRQSEEIAQVIQQLSAGKRAVTGADIMAAFGEKAFLLLKRDGIPVGVVGWKVENLVARTDEVYLDKSVELTAALKILMTEVEHKSQELQCEASLLFLPAAMNNLNAVMSGLGYQTRTIQSLGVRAWQEAASESMPPASILFFKQLRVDRVLRPV